VHRASCWLAGGPKSRQWESSAAWDPRQDMPIIEAAPPPRHEDASALALMPALPPLHQHQRQHPRFLIRGPGVPYMTDWVGIVFDPGQVRLAPRVCYSTSPTVPLAKEHTKQQPWAASTSPSPSPSTACEHWSDQDTKISRGTPGRVVQGGDAATRHEGNALVVNKL